MSTGPLSILQCLPEFSSSVFAFLSVEVCCFISQAYSLFLIQRNVTDFFMLVFYFQFYENANHIQELPGATFIVLYIYEITSSANRDTLSHFFYICISFSSFVFYLRIQALQPIGAERVDDTIVLLLILAGKLHFFSTYHDSLQVSLYTAFIMLRCIRAITILWGGFNHEGVLDFVRYFSVLVLIIM